MEIGVGGLDFKLPLKLEDMKNIRFTGRQKFLAQLHGQPKLSREENLSCKITILHGTGGMGKIQIALEYVYTNYREYGLVF